MSFDNYELDLIINRLIDNLNALADDTQKLIDHEKITTEKLKIAHEHYQLLASKYAKEDSEITCFLEKLNQPQSKSAGNDFSVLTNPSEQKPLFRSRLTATIDEVRLAAHQLSKFLLKLSGSTITPNVLSAAADSVGDSTKQTSQTTVLEKDFTEPGPKSALDCPFSNKIQNFKSTDCKNYTQLRINVESGLTTDIQDSHLANKDTMTCPTIISEMRELPHTVTTSSKCPIRFLGQRSPEEVARYFEIHKHEIPRSHEICLKRQQRNEDHIRKLDAKYGDLVSTIEALGQKHQPLLPDNEMRFDTKGALNERLECWVRDVSYDDNKQENEHQNSDDKNDQEQITDRPLKEVRVGESPSRPWGISVPICSSQKDSIHESPQLTRVSTGHLAQISEKTTSNESKMQELLSEKNLAEGQLSNRLSNDNEPSHYLGEDPLATSSPFHLATKTKKSHSNSHLSPVNHIQSNFTETHHSIKAPSAHKPHMLFTGPVLIGYSTEETIKILRELEK